jgi:mRNA interferase YafQ
MLQIKFTNKMKRDVKLMRKRGKDMNKLTRTLELLTRQEPMPEQYSDHQLTGNLKDFRECHIEPDWLLIYQICEDTLILSASGTGTHSDLFS